MNSRKIKIMVLSHAFVKKINLSFFEALSKKKKYSVTCVCPNKIFINHLKIISDFKFYKGNLKILKLNLIFKHSRLFFFQNLKKYIKKEKPNYILVDNDPASFQSLFVIFYSFFFNYKLIYFVNENQLIKIFHKNFIKNILKLIFVMSFNFIFKSKIYKIFCYSNQIKKNFEILGYKKKSYVMPLGYDEKVFNMKNRRKKKKLVISYFGRITREKGIHVILKSLKNFKYNNWIFILDTDYIEDKEYYNSIIKYLKLNFNKKNYSLIKTDHYKIANHMRYSDIVILPSLHEEQYGRVIQESVACGSVAIASNIGALPEIIKDKDLLFSPNDHVKLKNIITKLTSRKYLNKKFAKLYKNILSQRTITKQINVFEKSLNY